MEHEENLKNLTIQQAKLCEKLLKIKDEFGKLNDQVEPSDLWIQALPIENIHDLHKPIHRLAIMNEKNLLRKTGMAMLEELNKLEESIKTVRLDIILEKISVALKENKVSS